jgi:hypothetical protein
MGRCVVSCGSGGSGVVVVVRNGGAAVSWCRRAVVTLVAVQRSARCVIKWIDAVIKLYVSVVEAAVRCSDGSSCTRQCDSRVVVQWPLCGTVMRWCSGPVKQGYSSVVVQWCSDKSDGCAAQ